MSEEDHQVAQLYIKVCKALRDMDQTEREDVALLCTGSAKDGETPEGFLRALRKHMTKDEKSTPFLGPDSDLRPLANEIKVVVSPNRGVLSLIEAYQKAQDPDGPSAKRAKLTVAPSSKESQLVLESQLRQSDGTSKQPDENDLWTPLLDSRCERCYLLDDESTSDDWERVATAVHEGDYVYFHGQSDLKPYAKHKKAMKCKNAVFKHVKPTSQTPMTHVPPSAPTMLNNTSKLQKQGLSEEDIELLRKDMVGLLDKTVKDEEDATSGRDNPKKTVQFKSVTVQGFGPFLAKQHFNLDFVGLGFLGADLAGLQSNGFGKTLLCATSVVWCLTGKLDPHVSRVSSRNIKSVRPAKCDHSFVELRGTVNDERFTIRRTLKTKQELSGCLGKTMLGGKLEDSETRIAKYLFNLGANTDLKWALPLLCAWTPFSDAGFFQAGSSEGTKRARSIISTIVGIQPFQVKLEKEKQKIKGLEDELTRKQSELTHLRVNRENCKKQQRVREDQRQQDIQQQIEDAKEDLQRCQRELAQKQQDIQEEELRLKRDIEEAEAEVRKVEEILIEMRQQHREKSAAVIDRAAEMRRWEGEIERVHSAQATLRDKTKCPTCQREIDDRDLVQRLLQEKVVECRRNLDQAQQVHKEAQAEAQSTRQSVAEKEEELETLNDGIENRRKQKEGLHHQLKPLQQNVESNHKRLERRKHELETRDRQDQHDDNNQADKLTQDIQVVSTSIQEAEEAKKAAEKRQQRLQKFIKIAQKALAEHVRDRVQGWLDRFFHYHGSDEVSCTYPKATALRRSQRLTVHFKASAVTSPPRRSKKARRSGARGADDSDSLELDAQLERLLHQPTLKWDNQEPRGIDSLSTSEYARYRLAVMLALSELLRASLGVDVNLLLLDECMIGMDALAVLDIVVSLRKWARQNQLCVFVSTVSRFDSIGFKFDKVVFIRRCNPRARADNFLKAQVLQYPSGGDDDDDDDGDDDDGNEEAAEEDDDDEDDEDEEDDDDDDGGGGGGGGHGEDEGVGQTTR